MEIFDYKNIKSFTEEFNMKSVENCGGKKIACHFCGQL